jgi:hypothetical protein
LKENQPPLLSEAMTPSNVTNNAHHLNFNSVHEHTKFMLSAFEQHHDLFGFPILTTLPSRIGQSTPAEKKHSL